MRILIFERNNKSAAAIKKGLEDLKFRAEIASSKEQVISAARNSDFDLIFLGSAQEKDGKTPIYNILLDLNIPIPILSLQGCPLDEDGTEKRSSLEIFTELIKKFQSTLISEEKDRGAKIHFGPLILDPISHKVWRDQKEINLTPKEYTLLEFFIRHPNQILSRTMIANHVWNQNFDFFTNVIDVYINYLRRKLDQGYKTKLIHTIRGKGYMLKEG